MKKAVVTLALLLVFSIFGILQAAPPPPDENYEDSRRASLASSQDWTKYFHETERTGLKLRLELTAASNAGIEPRGVEIIEGVYSNGGSTDRGLSITDTQLRNAVGLGGGDLKVSGIWNNVPANNSPFINISGYFGYYIDGQGCYLDGLLYKP